MIIQLVNADFSADNVGKIEMPRVLNPFTIAAIEASGNQSLTDEQKLSLDIFFEELGAFGTLSNLWEKMSLVFLPIIAGALNKSLVNYKDNTVMATPSSSYFALANGSLNVIQTTDIGAGAVELNTNMKIDLSDFSMFLYDRSRITSSANDMGIGSKASHKNSITIKGTGGSGNLINHIVMWNVNNTTRTVVSDSVHNYDANMVRCCSSNGEKVFALTTSNIGIQESIDASYLQYQDGVSGVTLGGAGVLHTDIKNSLFMYGSYLTITEMKYVRASIEKLMAAFIS